jgi:hypothetical protein
MREIESDISANISDRNRHLNSQKTIIYNLYRNMLAQSGAHIDNFGDNAGFLRAI